MLSPELVGETSCQKSGFCHRVEVGVGEFSNLSMETPPPRIETSHGEFEAPKIPLPKILELLMENLDFEIPGNIFCPPPQSEFQLLKENLDFGFEVLNILLAFGDDAVFWKVTISLGCSYEAVGCEEEELSL